MRRLTIALMIPAMIRGDHPPLRLHFTVGDPVAKLILTHLEDYAQAHQIPLLRLETGIHQREAIELYELFGFYCIPPFGPYTDDPLSRCYEKRRTG
jgi:ribosomal protein S18 acetylase RimI-like enzyme